MYSQNRVIDFNLFMTIWALKFNSLFLKALVNAILFQVLWLIAVQGNDHYAIAATLLFLAVHAHWYARKQSEWTVILIVSLPGYLFDSISSNLGLFYFYGTKALTLAGVDILFAPLWLLCLWLGFASTLNHSLGWMQKRVWLASIVGAIAAPLSYFAGAQFSQSRIAEPVYLSLLIHAGLWSLLMPLFVTVVKSVCEKNEEPPKSSGIYKTNHLKAKHE
jgi:hypothetical protein